ncbi:DUF5718 family protein [Vibrio salinus]|uniref:DUF5718 family protein n=1 Tax=Vibrio salinus TaxID=2899784 RepID=UPI001E2E140B|nr:DUF5718 family protein [Vibrio salinus]MCE0495869.1 DUF5718 family protein [Vibrio salinus]
MDLKQCIGLGVAGNFAKHLEQAGEMKDFVNVQAKEGAPKGIFPFYLPKSDSFLNVFPLSGKQQVASGTINPQLEPEVALYCELEYKNKQVVGIHPRKFAAFNDCTVRKDGATKISQKKNWGECSKGVSDIWIDLDKFSLGGTLDDYKLASFAKRDGVLHPYGVDTEVLGYSYFYEILIDWLIDKMNNQEDTGPLENISALLSENGYPEFAVISVGATAYEPFGEQNYLESGDEIFVAVYPKEIENIAEWIEKGECPANASILKQSVV